MKSIETGAAPASERTIQEQIIEIGRKARAASRSLMGLTTETRNRGLLAMADALDDHRQVIREENEKDVADGRENKLTDALVDRLILNESRLDAMIGGLRSIAELPDPVGRTLKSWEKENGLLLNKMSVPIGVIGMIYESRPTVTAAAAARCLKAADAVSLRVGRAGRDRTVGARAGTRS